MLELFAVEVLVLDCLSEKKFRLKLMYWKAVLIYTTEFCVLIFPKIFHRVWYYLCWICDDLPFSFRQILFAIQFLLQQLKHNDAGIVKLATDVMVKVLSLGKVGRINCVFLGFVTVSFFKLNVTVFYTSRTNYRAQKLKADNLIHITNTLKMQRSDL